MLKKIMEFIVGVIFTFIIFIVPAGIAGNIETHYTQYGTVVEMDGNIAHIVDAVGNEWLYENKILKVNDTVKMKFFNGCTDNTVKDDEIVKITIVED